MINIITLDWDIEFETMRSSVSWGVLRRFIKDNSDKISKLWIRKSSGGNTHVKIEINISLTQLEIYEIRSFLRDDIYRIKLDHVRDLVANNNNMWNCGNWKPGGSGATGRLWDWKIKDDEIKIADDWVEINVQML